MTTRTASRPPSILWPAIRDFFIHVIGQVRILRKAYAGLMHFLIFWGMTVQVIGTIIELMQIQLFIPFVELGEIYPVGTAYLWFELIMDTAGVALLSGVLMAAFRRAVLRPRTLDTTGDDVYALIMLALIPLLGFTTEGLRLVAANPDWANWSYAGSVMANLLRSVGVTPESAIVYHSALYWAHIIAGVTFVASIPFTKLRHLITAPLNVIFRSRDNPAALPPIEDIEETEILGATEITEFSPQTMLSFDACLRCGRCMENCPCYNSGIPFAPRDFIQTLRHEMNDVLITGNGNSKSGVLEEDLNGEMVWYCTTCGNCIDACPVFINPIAEIMEMRRSQALMTGSTPNSVGLTLRNMERQGNPWGMPAPDRMLWADGLDVPVLEPGQEVDVLLYVGCAFSYDDRSKKAGKALIELLNAAGVDYGILGEAEACCGETARRLGNEYIFQVSAQENIEIWNEFNFKRIVTQCAHCFNTIKNEYPQFGGNFKVMHYTELLAEISDDLPIAARNGLGNVTYHDSCYLGRYNDIYGEPRDLLKQAGVNPIEMQLHHDQGFCCGGGGGGMWMETDAETRINNTRLQQALGSGADAIATGCPYCMLMLDDAIRTTGTGDQIQVLDIAEILAERLEK